MADAKKKKEKKPSFVARMKCRWREVKRLGKSLKDEPKAFPAELRGIVRRFIRKIWSARGGGLYACGFAVTFIYLEIKMFFVDVIEADSIAGFFTEQLTEIVFKYLGESIQNTISAFIWPVFIIEIDPAWGIGILVVMYLVFAAFLKAPLERWLFTDDAPEQQEIPNQ